MKYLLISLLSLITISGFASTQVSLICKHNKDGAWALGGKPLTMTLQISRKGFVSSGVIGGESVYLKDDGRDSWVHVAQNGDDQICSTGGCVKVYSDTSYYFYDVNLSKVRVGQTIQVLLSSNNYGASFEEDIDCSRVH